VAVLLFVTALLELHLVGTALRDNSSKLAGLALGLTIFAALSHSFLLWLQVRVSLLEVILNGTGLALAGLGMLLGLFVVIRFRQRESIFL
jgi:hypothetical protein